LDEELPRARRVAEFTEVESTEEMLAPSEPVRRAFDRLQEIRGERTGLQPEARRRTAEQEELDARYAVEQVRLDARYEALSARYRSLDEEEDLLRMVVMSEIGAARGIEGIATWETVDTGRKSFDEEWLRADEPEMYEKYSTKFDAARFRKDHPKNHAAHMRAKRVRRFGWADEDSDLDNEDWPQRPDDLLGAEDEGGDLLGGV
jgi:hypothetical protein